MASRENSDIDIEYLIHVLGMENFDFPSNTKQFSDTWQLAWRDLVSKTEGFQPEQKTSILLSGFMQRLKAEGLVDEDMVNRTSGISRYVSTIKLDFLFICVLEVEWSSTLELLRSREFVETDSNLPFGNLKLFSGCLGGVKVQIGVTMVGRAHNIECMSFCLRVFNFVRPRFAILSGICAGDKSRLRTGDVVSASQIWQIDRGKKLGSVENAGSPEPYKLPETSEKKFSKLREVKFRYSSQDTISLRLLSDIYDVSEKYNLRNTFQVKKGIILAGSYVRRDGLFSEDIKGFSDSILAIEMEGAGFAAACDQAGVDWFVFRGVSDYGDAKKDNDFQPLASFNASRLALEFIANHLVEEISPLPSSAELSF